MTVATDRRLRVGLLGWGSIGRSVGAELQKSAEAGDTSIELTAVSSHFTNQSQHPLTVPAEELGDACDVVVEAAGSEALQHHGERLVSTGTDLLVVSIGALMNIKLRQQLAAAGPGRVYLCSGAIGGLDLLAAARSYGSITRVVLETTKPGATLVRDWMTDELRHSLAEADPALGLVECFRGSVAEAVELFPESLNVSAALAIAAGDESVVEVAVIGSPTATTNTHDIHIESAAGTYRFIISNRPSPDNPRTSHITAWAVLQSLRNMAGTDRMAFR